MGEGKRFSKFEASDAWQVARKLTNRVYALTRSEGFSKDFSLVDQIRRASVSVMSNIAEGSERDSNKDYIRCLFIAKASAGETRSVLYVALDQDYITQEQFRGALDLCRRSSQLIWGLIKYLRKNSNKR
jgi:four helix bundle protein